MSEALTQSYSILQEPWWWDATALNGWQQATVEVDGRVVARWPYVTRTLKGGPQVLSSPPLTNRAGPWLKPGEGKLCTRYARSGEMLNKLIAELPKSSWFSQNLHPGFENWFPLHGAGFELHARLSYLVDDCSDLPAVEKAFSETTRRQLRKGKRNVGIEEIGPGKLIDLIRLTFERQGKGMRVSPAVIESVMEATQQRSAGRAVGAIDAEGKLHAAALYVWDASKMYYLVGGGDPELRSSGAGTYVLWEGLRDAGERGISFDFEGSMIPAIERFFRGFGAQQDPYVSISRGSPLVRLAFNTLKKLRR